MSTASASPTALAQTNGQNNGMEARPATRIVVQDNGSFANLLDTAKFEHLWRVAKMYAATELVPAQFRNKPEDCLIAIQMAIRLNVDPMMFMQKTYVVGGKPGMEAQLAIALVNDRGPFKGAIQWTLTGEGMSRQATAWAIHKETGEKCECTVTMKVAEAEGWLGKGGSKWKTMPDQMLRYRSAAWLARLYAPECLMGMHTTEELEDTAEVRTIASLPTGRSSFRHEGPAPREIVDTQSGEVSVATSLEPKSEPKPEAAEPAQPDQSDIDEEERLLREAEGKPEAAQGTLIPEDAKTTRKR